MMTVLTMVIRKMAVVGKNLQYGENDDLAGLRHLPETDFMFTNSEDFVPRNSVHAYRSLQAMEPWSCLLSVEPCDGSQIVMTNAFRRNRLKDWLNAFGARERSKGSVCNHFGHECIFE